MTFTGALRPVVQITANHRQAPPEWALLERLLIDTINLAAVEFVERYTRPDRTLIWRDRWPGMDGSDDPYEGFMNFPLFYALGGSEEVYRLSRDVWEAITWQWTQYGQIHNEFDAYYDWMHHGESSLFFYFFGFADPYVLKDKQRTLKFAGLYTGDNPEVHNYDKEKRFIRSPITGSRGPRFQQTEEDWETHREVLEHYLPPFEDIPNVDGNDNHCPWSDDRVYSEILKRINERQARGDVPLNLCATSLVTHAYMHTGIDSYRDWVLNYVVTWEKFTERNGGITPDNIGLSGQIGEYNDGKWWGGYYGWRWPHGAMTILEPEIIACTNAVLLTGNMECLKLARSQMDMLWNLRKQEAGAWVVPSRHYDDGWRDYRPDHPMFPIYLWNISMQEEDAERAERGGQVDQRFGKPDNRYQSYGETIGYHMGFNGNTVQWFRYIRGKDPGYPVQILKMNYEMICSQLEKIRSDDCDPRLRDHDKESVSIHQWQQLMPVIIEGLAQLTLGGPMHVYHGGLHHARFRYYDANAARPGLPESVAALVESLTDKSAIVSLVNLSLLEEKKVIIQAGTFAEHCFEEAEILDDAGNVCHRVAIRDKWLLVQMKTGSRIRLRCTMSRYVNPPSYETPWGDVDYPSVLQGRSIPFQSTDA